MLCSNDQCDDHNVAGRMRPYGAHFQCIGLEAVPEGDWFCKYCAGLAGAKTDRGPAAAPLLSRAGQAVLGWGRLSRLREAAAGPRVEAAADDIRRAGTVAPADKLAKAKPEGKGGSGTPDAAAQAGEEDSEKEARRAAGGS